MITEILPPVEVEEEAPVRGCAVQTYAGTWYDQPEYCEGEAVGDTDYCEAHADVEDYEPDYEPDDDIDQNYWIERDSEDLWHDSGE